MRPILLKGHERSITCVIYNRDGDLIFTSAKDGRPTLWLSESGERVGTYELHNGAVWHLDVSWDSKLLVSGSADMHAKVWDVETGAELAAPSLLPSLALTLPFLPSLAGAAADLPLRRGEALRVHSGGVVGTRGHPGSRVWIRRLSLCPVAVVGGVLRSHRRVCGVRRSLVPCAGGVAGLYSVAGVPTVWAVSYTHLTLPTKA